MSKQPGAVTLLPPGMKATDFKMGDIPPCQTCLWLEMRPYQQDDPSVRTVDGRKAWFICMRAKDALTGAEGETCAHERTVGVCGPRGVLWERSENAGQPAQGLYAGDDDTGQPPAAPAPGRGEINDLDGDGDDFGDPL